MVTIWLVSACIITVSSAVIQRLGCFLFLFSFQLLPNELLGKTAVVVLLLGCLENNG